MSIGLNFYQSSIFYALSNANIGHLARPSNSILMGTIEGVSTAIQTSPVFLISLLAIQPLTQRLPEGEAATESDTEPLCAKEIIVITGVVLIEEVIFRGIIQNSIAAAQAHLLGKMAASFGGGSVIQYLCSPAARVALTGSLFALVHLSNAGTHMSGKSAYTQSTKIFLFPVSTILYEVTGGNFAAPLAYHLSNNLLLIFLSLLSQPKEGKAPEQPSGS